MSENTIRRNEATFCVCSRLSVPGVNRPPWTTSYIAPVRSAPIMPNSRNKTMPAPGGSILAEFLEPGRRLVLGECGTQGRLPPPKFSVLYELRPVTSPNRFYKGLLIIIHFLLLIIEETWNEIHLASKPQYWKT